MCSMFFGIEVSCKGGCWVVIANIILRIALLAALLFAAISCRWWTARVMSRKADLRVDLREGAFIDDLFV